MYGNAEVLAWRHARIQHVHYCHCTQNSQLCIRKDTMEKFIHMNATSVKVLMYLILNALLKLNVMFW